ncbi:class I SAM-dependent methyltransferase [Oscillatoria sp. FACHB-1407]|nr:class I SAM-dependent methyltransferase [Oscillatoria sp. FACHB-1407]
MTIQQAFNRAALDYDSTRRMLIPCFDEFYGTVVEVISGSYSTGETASHRATPLQVLDLGAGTGLCAAMVQAAFPHAEFTLLDIAEEMLQQAKLRFDRLGKPPTIRVGSYLKLALGEGYDVVISALSIHHLSDPEKQQLYQRVYEALAPGGIFINADQVLGKTPEMEEYYQQQWLKAVKASDIPELDLRAAQHRMTFDRPATLDAQLAWLDAIGFEQVDCWYKNFRFAVFGGRRGGSPN